MRAHVRSRCSLLPALLLALFVRGAFAQAPAGMGVIVPPAHDDGLPASVRASLTKAAASARPVVPFQAQFAKYAWPLGRALGDHVVAVNYTDLDPGPGRLDYMGGTHNYDGHTGHDYTLYSFRDMDRGVPIRAAAPGVVTYLDDTSPYDRHCDFDWPDGGNWVWIAYGDGTYHEYLHMRRSSMTVKAGEAVAQGQMLGLVGSSGYSTAPHLHFESGDYSGPGGNYVFREPSHGSANALPSLWNVQDDYAGDDPFQVADLGVFTDAQVGGSVFNTSYCDVVNSIPQPLTFGAGESHLDLWLQFRSRANDTVSVIVRRPDGVVYGAFDWAPSEEVQFGWIWAYWFFSPYVAPADYGTWHYQVVRKGVTIADKPFTVGSSTTFGPRFWPRGGRSFRIDGTVQRDTLRRLPYGPPVTYALSGAPSFVSLVQDSIVQIAATSTQASRSAFFRVVMTDAGARRDTAFYHVVDRSKPLDAPLDADRPEPRSLALFAGAQPHTGPATLVCESSSGGRFSLELFDAGGRRVRTLFDGTRTAGRWSVTWDGRDRGGAPAAAGLYFARLTGPEGRATARLVRLAR